MNLVQRFEPRTPRFLVFGVPTHLFWALLNRGPSKFDDPNPASPKIHTILQGFPGVRASEVMQDLLHQQYSPYRKPHIPTIAITPTFPGGSKRVKKDEGPLHQLQSTVRSLGLILKVDIGPLAAGILRRPFKSLHVLDVLLAYQKYEQ